MANCPIPRHSNALRHKELGPVAGFLHRWSIHSGSSWWIPAWGNRHSKRSTCYRWLKRTLPGPFFQVNCNCVPRLRIPCRWIERRRHIQECLTLGSIWRELVGIGPSSGCIGWHKGRPSRGMLRPAWQCLHLGRCDSREYWPYGAPCNGVTSGTKRRRWRASSLCLWRPKDWRFTLKMHSFSGNFYKEKN